MALGHTLKQARERRGLTAAQVAAATRMKTQVVEALEREDFAKIPAPVYGKGFLRLYAQYVGLDPAPLLAEYAAIAARPRVALSRVKVEAMPDDRDKELGDEAEEELDAPGEEEGYVFEQEPRAADAAATPAPTPPPAEPEPVAVAPAPKKKREWVADLFAWSSQQTEPEPPAVEAEGAVETGVQQPVDAAASESEARPEGEPAPAAPSLEREREESARPVAGSDWITAPSPAGESPSVAPIEVASEPAPPAPREPRPPRDPGAWLKPVKAGWQALRTRGVAAAAAVAAGLARGWARVRAIRLPRVRLPALPRLPKVRLPSLRWPRLRWPRLTLATVRQQAGRLIVVLVVVVILGIFAVSALRRNGAGDGSATPSGGEVRSLVQPPTPYFD